MARVGRRPDSSERVATKGTVKLAQNSAPSEMAEGKVSEEYGVKGLVLEFRASHGPPENLLLSWKMTGALHAAAFGCMVSDVRYRST